MHILKYIDNFKYQFQETLISSIVIVGKPGKRSNNPKKNTPAAMTSFSDRRVFTRGQAVQISGKPSKSQYLRRRKPKIFKDL